MFRKVWNLLLILVALPLFLGTVFHYERIEDFYILTFFYPTKQVLLWCTAIVSNTFVIKQVIYVGYYSAPILLTLISLASILPLVLFLFQTQLPFTLGVKLSVVVLRLISISSLILLINLFCYTKTYYFATTSVFNLIISKENLLTVFLDYKTTWFVFVISLIGTYTNLFSLVYMQNEVKKEKFILLLNLFVASMFGVVVTYSLFNILIFWELLGISSFFLINFYDGKTAAFKSSLKAFLFNRLSDVVLLVLVYIFSTTFGNTSLTHVQNLKLLTPKITHGLYLGLMLAAFVKSAQFIFYFWLPDSMDAPIPASALIHSATLVSAGIYLLIRFDQLVALFPHYSAIAAALLAGTITIAGLVLVTQTDLKKLLAFSTITNCAFIYILILTGHSYHALIYFAIHGFAKSNLFLHSGLIIKGNNHYQDLRTTPTLLTSQFASNTNYFLQVILLSTMPLALTTEIKHEVLNSLSYKPLNIFLVHTLVVYSNLSLIYGLKLVMLLKTTSIFSNKSQRNFTLNKKTHLFASQALLNYTCYTLLFVVITANLIAGDLVNLPQMSIAPNHLLLWLVGLHYWVSVTKLNRLWTALIILLSLIIMIALIMLYKQFRYKYYVFPKIMLPFWKKTIFTKVKYAQQQTLSYVPCINEYKRVVWEIWLIWFKPVRVLLEARHILNQIYIRKTLKLKKLISRAGQKQPTSKLDSNYVKKLTLSFHKLGQVLTLKKNFNKTRFARNRQICHNIVNIGLLCNLLMILLMHPLYLQHQISLLNFTSFKYLALWVTTFALKKTNGGLKLYYLFVARKKF